MVRTNDKTKNTFPLAPLASPQAQFHPFISDRSTSSPLSSTGGWGIGVVVQLL